MNETEISTAEFSKEVELSALPPTGKIYKLVVSEDIYPQIARRLGVVSVANCSGEIHLKANKAVITVKGTVRAFLVRECVSSLEVMDETIDDSFEVEYMRHETRSEKAGQADELNLTESHLGGVLDVGELLIQQVSLAMAPFPRKEGAASLVGEYGTEASISPFAVLQQNFNKKKTE